MDKVHKPTLGVLAVNLLQAAEDVLGDGTLIKSAFRASGLCPFDFNAVAPKLRSGGETLYVSHTPGTAAHLEEDEFPADLGAAHMNLEGLNSVEVKCHKMLHT